MGWELLGGCLGFDVGLDEEVGIIMDCDGLLTYMSLFVTITWFFGNTVVDTKFEPPIKKSDPSRKMVHAECWLS